MAVITQSTWLVSVYIKILGKFLFSQNIHVKHDTLGGQNLNSTVSLKNTVYIQLLYKI